MQWPCLFSPFLWLPVSIKSGGGFTAGIQFGHRPALHQTALIYSGVGSLPGPDILRYLVMDITTALRYAVTDLSPNKADITTVLR